MTNQSVRVGALLLAAILIPVLLCGCGKKEWPSVQDQEEVFSFAQIRAQREGGCLTLRARVQGAVENLETLILELEASEEPCPGCPFQPGSRVRLDPFSPQVRQQGTRIVISHCPLKEGMAYRIRLIGENRFSGIKASTSEVVGVQGPDLK